MNQVLDHAFAVILAGGSGTRLWPKSRDNTPKQFLKLGGDRTMMQLAVDRISHLIPVERIIVVTNAAYEEEVRSELPELPAANIVPEPAKRDTALAMAVGTFIAQKRDPEAVVTNIASDHVFENETEYRHVLKASLEVAAQKENIVTVGITPNGPNVNFGYIEIDGTESKHGEYSVRRVKSFKEKPDLETAKKFLSTGHYFWNANMYTWHAETMAAAFRAHMPESTLGFEKIFDAVDSPEFMSVLTEVYEQAPKVPIDIAIAEKAQNLVLIAGDFGWDDIGLWSTVYELGEKNDDHSVIVRDSEDEAPVVQYQSKNNLVSTNNRLVALVGVQDLVVIDSDDVLLILPRDRAADVKKVVEHLKETEQNRYL